jgi:sulfhydrogenase subunit beta (sulfur reductase)
MIEHQAGWLPRAELQRLWDCLMAAGWQIHAPQAVNGALVWQAAMTPAVLPQGMVMESAPASCRLIHGEGARSLSLPVAMQGVKPYTFAPAESLWRLERDAGGLRFTATEAPLTPIALLGVRSCDLAALALQRRHFTDDPWFNRRLASLWIIAVNCSQPAATCFCSDSGDGPSVTVAEAAGADWLIDELEEGWVVAPVSDRGIDLWQQLMLAPVSRDLWQRVAAQRETTIASRSFDPVGLRDRLPQLRGAPLWQAIGERCLGCGNCSAVCPTCFCHTTQEQMSLDGGMAEMMRQWDSCFSPEHSALHGHAVHNTIASRYRQWFSHKHGDWWQQYQRSGCVGCGRCLIWCPVAIDITAVAADALAQAVA